MNNQVKKELIPIVCALGFLCIYAEENEKESNHQVFKLIKNLTQIVKLYKSKYVDLLSESFDIFDSITAMNNIKIDTIAFANAMLVFHSTIKKNFNPDKNMVSNFWIEYKKANKQFGKEDVETYKNSRYLATEFFKRI